MSKHRAPWDTEAVAATYPTSDDPQKLFDITCVVGSVYKGGTEDPRVVAFELIARSGHDGEFSFPNPNGDGTTLLVGVATVNPAVNGKH